MLVSRKHGSIALSFQEILDDVVGEVGDMTACERLTTQSQRAVRVMLVDDHRLFAEALVKLLEDEQGIAVVGVARDGDEAVSLVERCRPDVVLMDLTMPGCNGLEATRRIRVRCPGAKVIITTASEDQRSFIESVRVGAYGYVPKTSDFDDLLRSIHRVAGGEPAIPESRLSALLTEIWAVADREPERANGSAGPLTRREKDVLRLLVVGNTYHAIADQLCISENTVRTHVEHMQEKLRLTNRAQLIAYAVENDLGPPARAVATLERPTGV